MRKNVIIGAAFGIVATLAIATPATAATTVKASSDDGEASLSVLHAIPKTPVDVYVDGVLTLNDFKPGTLAGPLSLDPGKYTIAITAADAKNDNHPVIGPFTVRLRADDNYTAVAYLDIDGDATAKLYKNNISDYGKGQGRLVVRHNAFAGDVDVLAGKTTVIEDESNTQQRTLNLAAGTVSASVALANTKGVTNTSKPVLGPADVKIAKNTTTIVYAWGSAKDGTLALAVQTIAGEK